MIKTAVSEVGKNQFKLSVEVPAADLETHLDRTYRALAQEVRVAGFRPGKVPRQIINQRLGKDFVRNEALKDALPEFYSAAVEESGLDVVAPPTIDVTTFEDGQDLVFEATVETRPTPELGDYAGLKVEKPSTDVTDEEVDEQIERLRVRFASLEVVERAAKEGDFALIDLKTYRHDETIEELSQQDLLVEVGAGMIVPELDEELKEKRRGDILKLTTTLEERFGERAGWQVGMQVLVKEIKARNLPELDDDFATTVSEFDTIAELRSDIRDRLTEMKESQADSTVRERVIDAFLETVSVDLPEGMVEFEVDTLIESLGRMLYARGATLEQFMEAEDLDGPSLRQRFREQAEKNLALRLGLDLLASEEGIEVAEEDRTEQIERLAQQAGREPDEVREMMSERGDWASVDGDIMRSKALDLLVQRAEITTEEPS